MILTVTWGQELLSSWIESLFIQSYYVGNFKTAGEAKTAGERIRCPRKKIHLFSKLIPDFSFPWKTPRYLSVIEGQRVL